VNEFDYLGPLPRGTTLLEASAGTGKTYTIAALVTRYVAEGVARLDELLVVTFGRAATRELRDRVRERLVSARDGLQNVSAALETSDDLLRWLADAPADEVARRRDRLVQALASFDAATVATTHAFAEQVLIGLGTSGDFDAGAVFVENLDDLVEEVVQDLYLRKWGSGDVDQPPMSVKEAKELARVVVTDGQAELVPPATEGVAGLRHRFACAVRDEVERRKRRRRIVGYDDLLTRLRDTLAAPDTGPAAAARLRDRYRIVMVDEFQDTDPVQWEILERAFHGAVTLVLIGDPKQAIYAFRGADVYAYLDAAAVAHHRATLAHNWRSDPDLLTGLGALFRGAELGDPRISVLPVRAAHDGRSLTGDQAAVRLRLVRREDGDAPLAARARELVTEDVVREVVGLLESGAFLTPRAGSGPRPLVPGDIAVITRTNAQQVLVHEALVAAGVPSVQRTTSSVFRTPAAADWIVLLEALEQPHRAGRVRRLAVSPFVGWDAARLDSGDVDALGLRLHRWLRLYEERGLAALFEAVSREERLAPRLLREIEGERRLTDLRHVGESVHAAAMSGQLGLTAVLEWLRRRVEEALTDVSLDRSRRLDSDAAAVQVVTVHSSKGLEFPVVFVPFGWDRWVGDEAFPRFHDDEGHRVRNVGGPSVPGFGDDCRRHVSEELGEDLRLLYVALTRAQSSVTAWWAPSRRNTEQSPLHRVLFGAGPTLPESVRLLSDGDALARAAALARPGCLSVEAVAPGAPPRWAPASAPRVALAAARFDRGVDIAWRRTSYSALTAAVHEGAPMIGSEPEVEEKDDEPQLPVVGEQEAVLSEVVSPMSELPGGAAFGTLVHAVLEAADLTVSDLETELGAKVSEWQPKLGPAEIDPDELARALLPAVQTPLGSLVGGRPLSSIAPADRLTELEFELPLCGGDRPRGTAQLRDLAALLRRWVPADDPLHAYAAELDDPALGQSTLRGYLTGSIDAVLRIDGRYVVVDYKTNRLAAPDSPLTAWHYRPEALADAMLRAHYPLQALLYEVALHRFLRWRLPAYDPARDLGGVLYLFLRGMCGPSVEFADGSIPGIFAWQPRAELVVATSDLLAGAS
jgi:exodeoxyribonuclease V beta subunit